jgi:ATP-dependent DNA helicase RecG
MKALRSLNEKFNLPLPEYAMEDPFLTLTFPRNMESVKNVSSHKSLAKLSEEELVGYEFIKLKGKITRKEYEKHFNYDKKKAERHLTKMNDEDLIGRKGSGPSTYYEIIAT